MSKVKYSKLIKDLHEGLSEAAEDMAESGVHIGTDELALEMASSVIYDEEWIKSYLESRGVSDFEGRLADDIYSGRV